MKALTKELTHALLVEQAYYFQHLSLGFNLDLVKAVLEVVPDAAMRATYPNSKTTKLKPITPEQGRKLNEALIRHDAGSVWSSVLPAFTPYTDEWAETIPATIAVEYQLAQVEQVIDLFEELTDYSKTDVHELIEKIAIRPDFFNLLGIEDVESAIAEPVLPLSLEEAVNFTTELQMLDYEAGLNLLYIITAYEE